QREDADGNAAARGEQQAARRRRIGRRQTGEFGRKSLVFEAERQRGGIGLEQTAHRRDVRAAACDDGDLLDSVSQNSYADSHFSGGPKWPSTASPTPRIRCPS